MIENLSITLKGGRKVLLGYLRTNQAHRDDRGNVRETYRFSDIPGVPPVKQMVRSKSKVRVRRAMHAHKKQWDIWHFVEGDAFVVLYEPLTDACMTLRLGPTETLFIPPGIAHGFEASTDCTLTYLLTEEYDGSDEYGFDADDPDFPGSPLWTPAPIESDRDKFAPSLAEFKALGW